MANDEKQVNCHSLEKTKIKVENTKDKKEMQELILALPTGTIIYPRVIAMQDDRYNYYNWIDSMEGVEKRDGKRVRVG